MLGPDSEIERKININALEICALRFERMLIFESFCIATVSVEFVLEFISSSPLFGPLMRTKTIKTRTERERIAIRKTIA